MISALLCEYYVEKYWDNRRVKSELLLRELNLRLQYAVRACEFTIFF